MPLCGVRALLIPTLGTCVTDDRSHSADECQGHKTFDGLRSLLYDRPAPQSHANFDQKHLFESPATLSTRKI